MSGFGNYYKFIVLFQPVAMQHASPPAFFKGIPVSPTKKTSPSTHPTFFPSHSIATIRIASPVRNVSKGKLDEQLRAAVIPKVTLSPCIIIRGSRLQQPQCSSKTRSLLKSAKKINHNLSTVELSNPEGGFNYRRRKGPEGRQHIPQEEQIKRVKRPALACFLQHRKASKENCTNEARKYKETPSFLRKKVKISLCILQEAGIRILKRLDDKKQLVLHQPSQFLLQMTSHNKVQLSSDVNKKGNMISYLKLSEIDLSLLVRHFGRLTDQNSIYIFQEYLSGQTLNQCRDRAYADFNESTVGPIVCSILTDVKHLRSIDQPYHKISPEYIIHCMNICKFKREFLLEKGPQREIFFDIWCIGKLAFEMVTHTELVPKQAWENLSTVDQIFSSKEITKHIEAGFKKLEEIRISTEFIEFLIVALWDVQKKQADLDAILGLQFVELYNEDSWMLRKDPIDSDKLQ